jgi:hypothetical protein
MEAAVRTLIPLLLDQVYSGTFRRTPRWTFFWTICVSILLYCPYYKACMVIGNGHL